MERPEVEIEAGRRRAMLVVLVGCLVTIGMLLADDRPRIAAARTPFVELVTLGAGVVVLCITAATVTRRLRLGVVERTSWVVMASMLWVWDLVAATQVTRATIDLHVLDVTKTTSVLVVGAFLIFEERTARAAAGASLAVCALSFVVTASRGPVSSEAMHSIVVLVVLAFLAEGLSGTSQVLRRYGTRLRAVADRDQLTDVLNRRGVVPLLDDLPPGAGLVLVDLDHFKQVNDEHGHLAGDLVLERVASILLATVRDGDDVCRWGGEEFLVIVPTPTAPPPVELAERLRHAVATSSGEPRVTVSAGATRLRDGEHWETALGRADLALYEAKVAGRDRVVEATR